MRTKIASRELEPNAFVSSRCNLACVFCSAKGEDRVMGGRALNSVLDRGFETLSLEGGEPLLDKKLEKRAERAARHGSKEIILFTNGLLLDPARTKALLKSGVTRINFNLPAHTRGLHDILTGSKSGLQKKIAVIRDTIRLSPPQTVIITFVVNSLNYTTLPSFINFSARRFKGLFYVSLNLVKVKGRVKNDTSLVPVFSDLKPFLLRAFKNAKALGLRVITDGFPLCIMNGFEHLSVDAQKLMRRDGLYMGEKTRTAVCSKCPLACLCAGPRRDYTLLYGSGGLFPSKTSAKKVISAVLSNGAKGAPRGNMRRVWLDGRAGRKV